MRYRNQAEKAIGQDKAETASLALNALDSDFHRQRLMGGSEARRTDAASGDASLNGLIDPEDGTKD